MCKITPFLPPRIPPTNTKLYDLKNQGQSYFAKNCSVKY